MTGLYSISLILFYIKIIIQTLMIVSIIRVSKNDNIEEIKVIIEKYLIIPKAKQMSLF